MCAEFENSGVSYAGLSNNKVWPEEVLENFYRAAPYVLLEIGYIFHALKQFWLTFEKVNITDFVFNPNMFLPKLINAGNLKFSKVVMTDTRNYF